MAVGGLPFRWPPVSVALLALFALLPLQWIAVPAVPFGLDYLHELAILCFTAFLLLRLRARTYAPAVKTGAACVVVNLYRIGAIAASQLYLGQSLVPVARQLLYLASALVIACYFCRALKVTDAAVIAAARLSSVVLCVSLLIGLG